MPIIPRTAANWQRQDWQTALAEAITDPAELLQLLALDASLLCSMQSATQDFALRVPRRFVARMQKGNLNDPLLRQVLPIGEECIKTPAFSVDPLHEQAANPLPGLLHKYHGRVLLTVAGACGVNCRYCFRRTFPYSENNPGRVGWDKALAYIAADTSISEVILSGGDPLLVTDQSLQTLINKIADINHVTTLRIHTRMPIVIPERVTSSLIEILTTTRLQVVMVLHCNHAQEIDEQVYAVIRMMRDAHITLLNQSVLLHGVNDNAEVLAKLSVALFRGGVLPYYLHMLDQVQGAAHFAVSEENAQQLYAQLLQLLPGYLVPRLVREIAGAGSKLPLQVLESFIK